LWVAGVLVSVHRVRLGGVAGIVCVGIVASIAATALASDGAGALDRSFGDHGKVLTRFEHGFGHPLSTFLPHANAVVIDSGDRVVAIGTADRRFALARYKSDGDLDRSFSENGKVKTQVSPRHRGAYSKAYAGAIDSHGRIVVAGFATAKLYEGRFALARYKPDGHLDRSFGHDGKVTTDLRLGDGWAYAVAIDSRDRIVAAGIGGISGDFALIRYESDGQLDRSFGMNGRVMTDFGGEERAFSLAIDSQGRIVAGGFTQERRHPSDFALARYEPDGTLDSSFGSGGKVVTNFAGRDYVRSIAIDSEDRIVGAGESGRPGDFRHFALARYSEDGSLDGSFGTGGRVTTDFEDRSRAEGVAIDSRGRIVGAGPASSPGHRKFAMARYTPNGDLDARFSHDGRTITTFGSGKRVQGAEGVAIDSRQRVVAAGYAGGRFALARYLGR
jgi:uncharacterized delta-60 repeat protein